LFEALIIVRAKFNAVFLLEREFKSHVHCEKFHIPDMTSCFVL